jgi:hypothetical protein
VQDGVPFMGGLLKTPGHGRTDNLPINVPSGAYVLPADVVSGLGQGNTLAGAKQLDAIFGELKLPLHSWRGPLVPIVAAGGEYVVHPLIVSHLGDGVLKRGHNLLDRYVKDVRMKTHKTLGKLPGPAK